jgi:outer membrane protein assembly factor BamB
MRNLVLGTLLLGLCVTTVWAGDFDAERLHQWHRWRGPNADGVAPHADPPITWDEATNVRWKVEIPGLGSSTPIVWGDQVFVLTAIKTDRGGAPPAAADTDDPAPSRPRAREAARRGDGENTQAQAGTIKQGRPGPPRGRSGRGGRGSAAPTNVYQFVVLSFDRRTGERKWQHTANETVPHEGFREGDNTFASGSPVTDGRYLYASFGSYGVYCYDLEGKPIWNRDLGDMQTRNGFGEGSSPALYGNRLIVPWDHEGQSAIYCLDAESGETIWEARRDESTAWATPLVIEHGGRTQVVTNATNRSRSYDLNTGELLWECGGQTANAIPSPVSAGNLVYCMSGFRGSAVFAIPLDAAGDLTGGAKVSWYHDGQTSYRPGTPYVPSPLLYGDLLYFTKSNNAILSCLKAETGEVVFDNERIAGLGTLYASPVAAADRVYLVDRDGTTVVFKRGASFEVLATNKLDDSIDASPALVGNEIFLRGKKYLYCIAEK